LQLSTLRFQLRLVLQVLDGCLALSVAEALKISFAEHAKVLRIIRKFILFRLSILLDDAYVSV
jgi:hypothetical protein